MATMVAVVLMLLCWLTPQAVRAQQFFNLSADEVAIDSMLPRFNYTMELGPAYADSVYRAEILYPEFVDMTSTDIARYKKLCGQPLPELPEVEQTIGVSRRQGSLSLGFVPLVQRNGRYQKLVSFMLKVEGEKPTLIPSRREEPTPIPSRREEPTPIPSRREGSQNTLVNSDSNSKANQNTVNSNSKANQAPLPWGGEGVGSRAGFYASHSVLSSGRWAKISVPESGIYQITEELIRKAGLTDINKVKIYGYGGNLQPETLTREYLASTDDLHEVPQCIVGGKHLFYALGPVSWSSNNATTRIRNPYADYGCYFLTENDSTTATLSAEDFLAAYYPRSENYHVLHEIDNYVWIQHGRNLYENSPINAGASKTYTIRAPKGATSAKLSVTLSSGINSSASVAFNGRTLGNITMTLITYEKGRASNGVFNLSADDLKEQNEVTITTNTGGPVRLDFISLTLSEPTEAPDLQNGTFATPDYVYNITNQDLHSHEAVDMTIIIPTSQKLRTQAERLATFHESYDGLSVRIVPADEIYNEFSSGTPDATAYKRYMKMLYDRAESAEKLPRYLLLFGDCASDNRMLSSEWRYTSPDDYLLCYESENSFSETYSYISEEFFAMLDDNEALTSGSYPNERARGLSDIGVGRFPVASELDAKTMVDKVIAYSTDENAGAWQNTVVFMGDDGNNNIHMRDINALADSISATYPGFLIKKIMWDAYTRQTASNGYSYPEAQKAIKQLQAQGALIMDYAGHGRADQVSHENVLRLNDFEGFTNKNLPLWVTASCDIAPFDGSVNTIGEAAVTNSKGGAVAFFGTTRTVFTTQNRYINSSFIHHVLAFNGDKPYTLGDAVRLAKNEVITKELDRGVNLLQFQLLGDPALALKRPTYHIVIDSINGVATKANTQQLPTLKAGSVARIAGHIENAPSFNGIISVTVRDNLETIVCKMNDKTETEEPFVYKDRTKTLFAGSDSVRNGRFTFTCAVPKDINYANETGLITAYAVNDDHTMRANGESDRFLIGGTAALVNDSIGPSIYCYLNSPSFTNGGNVNTTPYFVAEVTDQNGINTSGNGIGHDLELIIDGRMERTYVLNENFEFDFGSYTTGSTYYNIPELEPGQHKLVFRAWDILNNSSTAELTFNVVRGLRPSLFSVSCTQNPARESTTFIINHDRTGSTMDVELDVFDPSGRLLWQHNESGVSTSNAYTLDWNLTVDGGQRLQTGVYLYRVRIATDGSAQASKAQKLVVIQ